MIAARLFFAAWICSPLIYDLFALLCGWPTFSKTVYELGHAYPVIWLLIGIAAGHLSFGILDK